MLRVDYTISEAAGIAHVGVSMKAVRRWNETISLARLPLLRGQSAGVEPLKWSKIP